MQYEASPRAKQSHADKQWRFTDQLWYLEPQVAKSPGYFTAVYNRIPFL